ncbi:MAG: hypothetical protein JO112_07690 [Planctomycetes bacterium]|nr:hypothetical protein [Planctomycetota bacterium]
MKRKPRFLLAGVLLALSALPWAAAQTEVKDQGLSGTWKVSLLVQGQHPALWLVRLQSKEGKWTGEVLASDERMGKTSLTQVNVTPEELTFLLQGEQGQKFSFEGKPSEAGKVLGSMKVGRQLFPAELDRTQLTSLDSFGLSKEVLATKKEGPDVIEAASTLLSQAADKKATAADVSNWADRAFHSSAAFGRRYQRNIAQRIAQLLTESNIYPDIAVDYARRAEKLITSQDSPAVQKQMLEALGDALEKAGQNQEAQKVREQDAKIGWVRIEAPKENAPAGRPVLVELFTGTECPPCVAADLAFDAVGETYKQGQVVELEYHLHVPGPDPLTNPDTEAREKYYGEAVQGTPAIFFDGHFSDIVGGSFEDAQDKYEEFDKVISPLMKKPAGGKLQATAVRKGDKIEITAEASDVANPGENVRLRLALVEEQVNYKGGNHIPTFHHVVRALPGGADGLALKDKTGKQTVAVDLAQVRNDLKKYLDDFQTTKEAFPSKDLPLDLKNLYVVAFIQNDTSKDVLQVVRVPVTAEKGQ